MAKLSAQQVEYVAKLAHLSLAPSEVALYQDQLSRILEYVGKLGQVNTKKVAPTYQLIDNLANITRADTAKPPLTPTQALSGTKTTHNGYIVTQPIWNQ